LAQTVIQYYREGIAASVIYRMMATCQTISGYLLQMITAFANHPAAMNMNINGRQEISIGHIRGMFPSGMLRPMEVQQVNFLPAPGAKPVFVYNAIILTPRAIH
jgi:hypothetical protein